LGHLNASNKIDKSLVSKNATAISNLSLLTSLAFARDTLPFLPIAITGLPTNPLNTCAAVTSTTYGGEIAKKPVASDLSFLSPSSSIVTNNTVLVTSPYSIGAKLISIGFCIMLFTMEYSHACATDSQASCLSTSPSCGRCVCGFRAAGSHRR
jgi:hypothetical protein